MVSAMERRGINHGPEAPGAVLNACSQARCVGLGYLAESLYETERLSLGG